PPARRQRDDGQDPRRPRLLQARRARPGAGRRRRLRDRPGPAGRLTAAPSQASARAAAGDRPLGRGAAGHAATAARSQTGHLPEELLEAALMSDDRTWARPSWLLPFA